ncbi:unnamed protein product [Ascophyllum nodosum]
MDQRGSFRSEPASGDDGEVPAFTTPSFGQSNRRRSTGGGGGPVVIVGGIRGDDGGGFHGRGGSDLGSAGSPQYGSKRGSGLLGGDIWTAFPPQDLTLSPQARSDHNEDVERYTSEHSLFGSSPWRGALGDGGGRGERVRNGQTSFGTPVPGHHEAPRSSTPPGIGTIVAGTIAGGDGGGRSLASGEVGGGQVHPHLDELHDGGRNRSFEQRASPEGRGAMGYIHSPFQVSPSQQRRHAQQRQQQQYQKPQGFTQSSVHRREASTGSSHAARSPPFENSIPGEPPSFSGGIPESPSTAAPRSSGIGGLPRETSPRQAGDHQRRYSLPGPPQANAGTAPRPNHAQLPAYSSHGPQQGSPPLQPQRHRPDHQSFGRRSSSPAAVSLGGPGDGGGYGGGDSPVLLGVTSHRSPPSTLPTAFSSAANNHSNNNHNHDDASSIFSSNVSGHSNYSGFSGYSAFNAFGGGSDLGSVGGRDGGREGGGGGNGGSGNVAVPWRTPPLGSSKADFSGVEEGSSGVAGLYAAAHGSTGGALGWGAVMGTGGGGGGRGADQR